MEPTKPAISELEDAIRRLADGPPDRAAADLTAVANRAIIELHKVARDQERQRRGEADWGGWARLANAARGSVLQVATVRDSLKRLGGGAPPSVKPQPSAAVEDPNGAPSP